MRLALPSALAAAHMPHGIRSELLWNSLSVIRRLVQRLVLSGLRQPGKNGEIWKSDFGAVRGRGAGVYVYGWRRRVQSPSSRERFLGIACLLIQLANTANKLK